LPAGRAEAAGISSALGDTSELEQAPGPRGCPWRRRWSSAAAQVECDPRARRAAPRL